MALSNNVLFPRGEKLDGAVSNLVSGVRTVRELLFYIRRHDGDGPTGSLMLQHRWAQGEPWINVGEFTLAGAEAQINAHSAVPLGDQLQLVLSSTGPGVGGFDLEVLVEGRA